MSLLRELRRRGRHAIGPVLGLSAFGYFAYHGIQGDRGLLAYLHLNRQVAAAQTALVNTSAERRLLEHRVSLLRPERMDPDMLDERARVMLNMVAPDEIVILETAPEE